MIVCKHVFLAALAFAASCGFVNQSGNVKATRTGEVSDTPVPRVAFDAEAAEACGGAGVSQPDAVSRAPYLQQVDHDSAMILWTALSDASMRVEVTLPDGSPVAEVQSRVDESARPTDATQHVARVDGLSPATVYCYSVHAGDAAVIERIGFRTAPEAGAGAPVSFVVIGDMGSGDTDQFQVLEQVENVPFELMLTVGDNAYDDGTLAQYESKFFDVYASILQSIPVFPITGNHDYRTDDAAPFREVFALPDNGAPAGTERWYSFDWGDVHFVALDTEEIGATQADWLERDLAANERPWTIVYGHRPPYSSGDHGSDTDFRETFGPILARHRVPLVLSGHEHSYERTEAVDGTVYVVTGGGGRGTRGVGSSSFTAFAEDVLHFAWVRIEGDTLELHAIDASGQEFDSVKITAPRQ